MVDLRSLVAGKFSDAFMGYDTAYIALIANGAGSNN